MNTRFFAAIAAAAALSTSFAVAGTPMHRMPVPTAETAAPLPVYELKTDGLPQVGKPLLVSLIDTATGQAVSGGKVSMLRAVYRGPKAVPAIQYVEEALPQDGNGHFVCAAAHHTADVALRGSGPAGTARLTLSVQS
jgi:hypothetical protein